MAGNEPFALRLDMQKATTLSGPLQWQDATHGTIDARPEIFGDVVLARKETPTSYHLAVTLDDHIQQISVVTRGQDLFQASHVHTLLQALLDLNTPRYHHHALLQDENGKRFAKRDNAVTLFEMRSAGTTPDDIRQQLGFTG
jgi:glutamyl-Q tRNA(Asp) synthetase